MLNKKNINYINFITYFYFIIFFLLSFYTFYRAEFIYEGNQFSYYYKYYLIFISNSLLWFLAIFLSKKNKTKIVIFMSIIIFILYFYETIRFFAPSIYNIQIFNAKKIKSEKKEENFTKLDLIKKIKKENNIDVVPSIFPKILIENNWINEKKNLLPLGGVSNITTVFCKEGDEFSIYKSDRYGFNNPDFVWDTDDFSYFLIGDSFVQGSCVKQDENFASQIRKNEKVNAISLGMAGNGPLIEFATLKEYAIKKKPKNVLWFYFERNDLVDLKIEKTSTIIMNYLKNNFTQNLISNQSIIDKDLRKYIKLAEEEKNIKIKKNYSTFSDAVNKIIRLQIVRDKTSLDRGFKLKIDPLFKKILIKVKELTDQNNINLYFIYLPDKERYSSNKMDDDNYLRRSEVIDIVNSLSITLIDIHKEFFIKQEDPLNFYAYRIYGHYSAEGYNKIAKIIIDNIKK